MSIIASDANNLRPVIVNTLITTSGERYDFILEANQTKGKKIQVKMFASK